MRFRIPKSYARGAGVAGVLSLSLVSSCLCRGSGRPAGPPPAARPPGDTAAAVAMDSTATTIQMRNVDFHVGGDVVMHVASLTGVMRGEHGVVDFDDSGSFITWVNAAEVALDAQGLANLFNNHVFAYRGAPLRDIRIDIRGDQIVQSGILHKGVDIPFTIKAAVSLTPDGRIRLHPVDTDIFCVDGDKLMSALNLTMEKMVDVSKAVGVTIEKNDFIIDAFRILPPPRIRGRLTGIRIVDGRLVQQIGPALGGEALAVGGFPPPPDTAVRNYMYYRGGRLHFGRKLLMTDADMLVVDQDPSDIFDFDIDRYMSQLVRGYSRTLPNAGLYVVMADLTGGAQMEQIVGGEVGSPRDTACNCKPGASPPARARPQPRP